MATSLLDEYTVTFKSKPFGMTWISRKSDKDKNLFVSAIDLDTIAYNKVIIGSKLIKFGDENIENIGAKEIFSLYKNTYSQLPLMITFRKPFDTYFQRKAQKRTKGDSHTDRNYNTNDENEHNMIPQTSITLMGSITQSDETDNIISPKSITLMGYTSNSTEDEEVVTFGTDNCNQMEVMEQEHSYSNDDNMVCEKSVTLLGYALEDEEVVLSQSGINCSNKCEIEREEMTPTDQWFLSKGSLSQIAETIDYEYGDYDIYINAKQIVKTTQQISISPPSVKYAGDLQVMDRNVSNQSTHL